MVILIAAVLFPGANGVGPSRNRSPNPPPPLAAAAVCLFIADANKTRKHIRFASLFIALYCVRAAVFFFVFAAGSTPSIG